jgi:OPT family oligopeptide transporter
MDQKLSFQNYTDGTPMPVLNSARLFNSLGQGISAVDLYAKPDFTLDVAKYNQQAPIYISTYFALVYGGSFLAIASAFSHVYIWHWDDIKTRIKNTLYDLHDHVDDLDIHNLLMDAYPKVSNKSFAYFLVILFVFQYFTCTFTSFTMSFWELVLCTTISFFSILPIGIITAISGQRLGVNVLTEFVIGYMIPGNTVGVMAFKSLGTNSVIQAITLLSDLKLGHYMKINPRHMIFAQVYGSVIGAIINVLSSFWVMDSLRNLLGSGEWRATSFFLFHNAGAIWGAIGPARFFGPDSAYHPLLWCFLIGIILPFGPWYLHKRYPNSFWKFVNIPLLANFERIGQVQNFVLMPLLTGWLFQKHIKKNYYKWWSRYNYILAVNNYII